MIIKTKYKIKVEKHIGHGVAMRNMGIMECLLEKVTFEERPKKVRELAI